MMNPSYPLNYMEKPLTRLMLGRSWWDLNINFVVQIPPGTAQHQACQRFFHIVERVARVHHARFAAFFTIHHLVIDQRFFQLSRTLRAKVLIVGVAV
ncbi:secreted and surface-associated lipoprotein mucinase [Escherichia coli]|nr:secreted and surface-associated lipoprotein mucinase [Escherichia coli]